MSNAIFKTIYQYSHKERRHNPAALNCFNTHRYHLHIFNKIYKDLVNGTIMAHVAVINLLKRNLKYTKFCSIIHILIHREFQKQKKSCPGQLSTVLSVSEKLTFKRSSQQFHKVGTVINFIPRLESLR